MTTLSPNTAFEAWKILVRAGLFQVMAWPVNISDEKLKKTCQEYFAMGEWKLVHVYEWALFVGPRLFSDEFKIAEEEAKADLAARKQKDSWAED